MKQGIHPDYREVVFLDVSNNFSFKTRSTIITKEKIKWEDGQEYPLAKIETSSESHPFFTGTRRLLIPLVVLRSFVKSLVAKPRLRQLAMALQRLLRNGPRMRKPRKLSLLLRKWLQRRWLLRKRSNHHKWFVLPKAACAAFVISGNVDQRSIQGYDELVWSN